MACVSVESAPIPLPLCRWPQYTETQILPSLFPDRMKEIIVDQDLVTTWASVAATLLGSFLVFIGLIDGAKARKKANTIMRKTESLRMYVATIEKRSTSSIGLPLDRDRKAIQSLISRIATSGPASAKQTVAVREYLNYWEALARGVRDGVLDGDLLRGLARGRLIAIQDNYRQYIITRRSETGSSQIYQDIEWLAEEWSKSTDAL